MKIIVSNSSANPIYDQIVQQIRRLVISGELADASPLPSIRKLAHQLRISAITTKRAYEELEREGLIDSVAGKGMFVAAPTAAFLREKRLKAVEETLAQAVSEARMLGIDLDALGEMLGLLWEEHQEA